MRRPEAGEYGAFYKGYIDLTRGTGLLQNLQDSGNSLLNTLQGLIPDKTDYAYAEGKWTVKQMLRHIIDCDVVFLYRAIHIARGGEANLPGFDENLWAENASVEKQDMENLVEDFRLLRNFIINTYRGFTPEMLNASGTANNLPLSVLAQGFIIAGHTFHHSIILKERYL
ncbi:MAG: DinB family protein [Owenweeksia sp.]